MELLAGGHPKQAGKRKGNTTSNMQMLLTHNLSPVAKKTKLDFTDKKKFMQHLTEKITDESKKDVIMDHFSYLTAGQRGNLASHEQALLETVNHMIKLATPGSDWDTVMADEVNKLMLSTECESETPKDVDLLLEEDSEGDQEVDQELQTEVVGDEKAFGMATVSAELSTNVLLQNNLPTKGVLQSTHTPLIFC